MSTVRWSIFAVVKHPKYCCFSNFPMCFALSTFCKSLNFIKLPIFSHQSPASRPSNFRVFPCFPQYSLTAAFNGETPNNGFPRCRPGTAPAARRSSRRRPTRPASSRRSCWRRLRWTWSGATTSGSRALERWGVWIDVVLNIYNG